MPSQATTTAILESLARAALELPTPEAFDAMSIDNQAKAVDEFMELTALACERMAELAQRAEAMRSKLAEHMDRTAIAAIQINSVKRMVLVEDFTVEPKFEDLLPEGVKADDDRYGTTILQAQEAGRQRLINTLHASSLTEDLVELTYDQAGLAELICGDEAPTDIAGTPTAPAFLKGAVTIKRSLDVAVTGTN